MALLSLKYASVTEIPLLGMQMILCSRCLEILAQFAFRKFHLGFCSDLISGMRSPTWVIMGLCWLCGKSSSTCTDFCRGWPLCDVTHQRSGEYSRSPRAEWKERFCFKSITRLRFSWDDHSQSGRNVFVSSQLPDLGSVGTTIPRVEGTFLFQVNYQT